MLKIAIYGNGGIGKSTMTSNLAASVAYLGKKVIQIGCDPKADSTFNLLGGHPVQPVMNYLREHDEDPESIEDISRIGYGGVLCIETGGPTPGLGCAGRGIIATFSLLEDLGLFEKYEPDVVLYDVLGDVVCGGFAAPIREGYAEQVLIVTSGEKMALYAANNINTAVANFADRSYAKVGASSSTAAMSPTKKPRSGLLPTGPICPSSAIFPAAMTSTATKIWARPSLKAIRTCRSAAPSSIWLRNYYKIRNDYDRKKTLCHYRAGLSGTRP